MATVVYGDDVHATGRGADTPPAMTLPTRLSYGVGAVAYGVKNAAFTT